MVPEYGFAQSELELSKAGYIPTKDCLNSESK